MPMPHARDEASPSPSPFPPRIDPEPLPLPTDTQPPKAPQPASLARPVRNKIQPIGNNPCWILRTPSTLLAQVNQETWPQRVMAPDLSMVAAGPCGFTGKTIQKVGNT
jgi:hypothetical protein